MVIPQPKPSYREILKELDIEIINPICHSNSMNAQIWKEKGIKIQKLRGLKFIKSCACFLRYQDDFFYVSFQRKKGGYS